MNQQKKEPLDYKGMEGFFSNAKLFSFIWKWKIVFGISIVAAAIVAIVFSGPKFITPKYKSEAILYPVNLNEYADESLTEQMLQLLQSTDIKFRLMDDFGLYDHYKIDPESQFAQTYMFDELNDHLSFSKTSYESVRVTVMDKDPFKAAEMVDSIDSYYNQLVKNNKDIRTKERIQRGKKEMNRIQTENDSLKTRLKDLRKEYNLINPKEQTEMITEAYFKNSSNAREMYQNMIEYRDEIIFLDSLIKFNDSRYIEYKDDHDEHVTELNRELIYSSVVSQAIPADKKSYPVRWLILAGSVLAAVILCFVVLLIIENITALRK